MLTRALLLALPFSLLGCDALTGDGDGNKENTEDPGPVDSDGDGLYDDDEAAFGTDPGVADTDADGLTDKEEFDLGTDGTAADTDGDTYSDGAEAAEGTDPTDEDSRIYTGYWPYNPDKDGYEDPGFDTRARAGKTLAHFVGPDQYGEEVDIYDFGGQGKLTVIDLSGVWCYYCNEMAKWMEGRRSFFSDYESEPAIANLPDMVAAGDVQWVTVLDADASGAAISEEDLVAWSEDYENSKIAVLGDMDMVWLNYLNVYGYPTLLVVDSNMEIVSYNRQDYFEALVYAYEHAYDESGTASE